MQTNFIYQSKKTLTSFILPVTAALMIGGFSASSYAGDDIDASDPCVVTVCMYGKVTGTADSKCNRAITRFFTIEAVKKGLTGSIFLPWETLNARKKFLNGCGTADPGKVNEILGKFGKMRG